jgi:predicted transcriptional regulator
MRYLDAGQVQTEAASSPQEEVEAFLADVNYDFEALEHTPGVAQSWIRDSRILRSNSARIMAREVLDQVLRDAALLPLATLRAAMGEGDPDPVALARGLDRPLPLVLRRLAVLPELNAGLVVCDRSGSLLFRKPAPGFVIPRYGAACALWPLFAVLSQPGRIELSPLVQLGRGRAGFACFAVSEVVGTPSYNAAPLVQGTMLLVPRKEVSDGSGREVGSSCRVCPRAGCPGRREPSVLSDDA